MGYTCQSGRVAVFYGAEREVAPPNDPLKKLKVGVKILELVFQGLGR